MQEVTKETLLNTMGRFTWFWGCNFFIETEQLGNFIWSDSEYGDGDDTIRPFKGNIHDFEKEYDYDFGRDKGRHLIRNYCGEDITFITHSSKETHMSQKDTSSISNQLTEAGYDHAVAIATEAEISAGAACGQLSVIVEKKSWEEI